MTATVYEFVVDGELGDHFAGCFEGLELERRQGMTVLTGKLLDQAQLSGVLAQIQELGLELVSVDQPHRRPAAADSASAHTVQGSSPGGEE